MIQNPCEQNPYEASAPETSDDSQQQPWLLRIGISLAVIANAGAVLAWLPILRIEAGSSVRPMLEGGISMLFVLFGLVLALPICVLAIRLCKEHRLGAGIALVFCLLPFPLSSIVLQLIAATRGLTILE